MAVALTWGILTLWIKDQWPFAAFQGLIFLTSALSLSFSAPSAFSSPLPLTLPFAPALLAALQLAFGATQTPWQTRQVALEWLTHGCAAVLAYVTFRKSTALPAFALAAGLLALVSTLQNYTAPGRVWWLWDSGYSDGVYGPFLNHTKLANFAELAIPVAVWLAIHEPRRRALYITATAALAGSVVASASRGGMLVLLVEFAVLSIVAGRNRVRSTLALAAGVVLGIAVFGYELAFHRWTTTDPLADLRLPIIRSGLDMARAFFPFGAGLGSWRTVQPAFATFDYHITINQAHSDWTQWFAEGGLPWVAVMAAVCFPAVRAARREWWSLGVVFVLLHAFIDYPFQQTPALTTLILVIWASNLRPDTSPPPPL